MLIKTHKQNYVDIADAIRKLRNITSKIKPSNMALYINSWTMPSEGISYDSFDADGNLLTATSYGKTIKGFAGNTYLTNVNFPEGAIAINNYCFTRCTSLEISSLPDTIETIGNYAFSFCYNLPLVRLPSNLKAIGECAFDRTMPAFTELPSSVQSIGNEAFGWSTIALTKLPENLTYIGINAFINSNISINSVPSGVIGIYDSVFGNCTKITNFIFHDNIKTIGSSFTGCTNLTEVTFEGTPISISSGAFNNCLKLTTINVPWAEGEIANAPWGATNATINYNYVGE